MKMSFSNLIQTLVLIVLLATSLIAQNHPVFSEIMFYPSGDGNKNEYVELYNPTNQAIDLSDYRIKVATFAIKSIIAYNAGSTVLQPDQFAVIIEGDYDPVTGPYNFPPEALVVTINSTTFGPMANTSDRPVYLLNSGGDTLSVYTYSANNAVGYSDEKIILNTDNSSANWANSLVFNGTPGFKNSVSPKEKDIAVAEISVSPAPVIE
ncbi:MAG TPA: lamin tail domain-containing protein, partial [Ignavibacteria bacterium]|nr:lamin tail domain-containing protein [Ignavibacteria bacterium]